MKYRLLPLALLFIGATLCSRAQVSPDCQSAIPICNNTPVNSGTQGYGGDDFNGAQSSGCLEPTGIGTIESNSAWYRFRTGASGQLGFTIGFDRAEDWDFALYQASDCGGLGDPVRCNFFDNSDEESVMGVGEHPGGSPGSVLFEDWLQVSPGEDYYLLINNFSNTNSGFSIQFTGQIFQTNPYDALDCSIVSNLLGPPVAACDNETVELDATVPSALGYSWYMDTGNGFQLIPGAVSATYQPAVSAMYRVEVQTPSETIFSDVQVGFTPSPITYVLTDVVLCEAEASVDLSLKDPEALGPQDANQFMVSYHRNATDAAQGVNPLPRLYGPSPGIEDIYVRTTAVNNPDCYDNSRRFTLTVAEPPVGDFPLEVAICANGGTATIGDGTPNPGFSYTWGSGEQTPTIDVSADGSYSLTVTNASGGPSCAETFNIEVVISVEPVISDIIISDLQESNSLQVVPEQTGNFEYQLNNGPFQESPLFADVPAGTHTITARDPLGCGSVSETVTVAGFPRFFTPNGDGNNDLWHIEGIETLSNPEVLIFDRFGKLLRQLHAGSPGWDGTYLGREVPSSDYWFRLTYTDQNGQRVEARFLSSHFALKR